MGHDIYAYTVADEKVNADARAAAEAAYEAGGMEAYSAAYQGSERREERAYLRRNMGSSSIHAFYEYLGCTDLDGGVSGVGEGRTVPLATIRLAKLKMDDPGNAYYFGAELEFLNSILADKEILADGEVYIHFG